ncbi:probable inactive receptor kinase At1g27190 isoform X2 [Mangifera indica]|uniref:probable inactive receptor kinase At1g27190 isoform X2 n=1 Tax=Mangifera indica TaxID=29780 RepID=UPI001CFAA00A|nr:probable inactive receptor kinase At1g27190 isoform X2 [Mangifera indica]XP_044480882.1 probable inactive receptor kinase At1g27190 isoform X2 [Mangifera indica]XP_044493823.1 probable inactive receptor kinase At1g27190 isoform X2 [Mangifera indica]
MNIYFILASLLVLASFSVIFSIDDDVKCLEGIQASLKDPKGELSWSFPNTTVAAICKLNGVSCWNEKENRIIGLALSSMQLSGRLPESLNLCHSLETLDFSNNDISGPIPTELCSWLPYIVTLDLSNNQLSGPIPSQIVGCKYLNKLVLSNNKLSGSIPYEVSRLDRLKEFSVAGNALSGSIPLFLSNNKLSGESFEGNKGLCGKPLGKCGGLSGKSLGIIIAAGVIGALFSMFLGFVIWWWFFVRYNRKKRGYGVDDGKDDSSWIQLLRSHKLVQVSLFQKPIVKIKLADLLVATNSFNAGNIIISTRTGVSYKAVLPDGSALVIKRLSACKLGEKQFQSEMNRLGQLRHPNLVPLLGFCVVEEERLLLYKHMPNGTLYSLLHGNGFVESQHGVLDWSTRLRIGVGVARGLAWLHHGCQSPYMHQYVSSNVILIDDDFDARVTDFGLARLVGSRDSNDSSFINGDLGEFGYVAPECSSTMVASLKGDVYGFGVLLLELVTGQKPIEVSIAEEGFEGNLVNWVNHLVITGRSKDAIDKALCGKGNDDEITQFLKVACTCVVSRPKDRPSMYQIYESLKSMAERHGFFEEYEEFPLIFGKQDPEFKE